MHKLDEAILQQFKKNPVVELKTGELVKEIFIEEYDAIIAANRFRKLSLSEKREIKKKKAKLHRKLLYHLNKLEEEGFIKNSGFIGKGEKKYCLKLEEGELIIKNKNKQIIINKPASIATRIDGYISENIISKYSKENWINKKNAILINAKSFNSITNLHKYLRTIYSIINDTIAIDNIEVLINNEPEEEIQRFLEQLNNDSEDYNIIINLLVDLFKIKENNKYKSFINSYSLKKPRKTRFIFGITPKEIRKGGLLDFTIQELSKIKTKINLKNSSIHQEPIFFGRAGPYTLNEKEYLLYKNKSKKENYVGAVVGEAAVAIDINKLWSNNGNFTKFREILNKTGQAMFEVCRKQLKYFSNEYKEDGKNLISIGKTYIRLWNQPFEGENVENYLRLLESINQELKVFSNTQQNLYKSCGLPMRFNTVMSSCFVKFDPDFLSERRYKKTLISSLKQLQNLKEVINTRSKAFEIFEGADRFRIFLDKRTNIDETMKILRYLFNLTQLPTVTLDHSGLSGDLKLTNFM